MSLIAKSTFKVIHLGGYVLRLDLLNQITPTKNVKKKLQ